MDADSLDKVTAVVIEMEQGWIFVKITDPKPAMDRIEFFLRRAVDDWFDARPAFVIDRAEAIMNHGEMLGLHVWYHAAKDETQKKDATMPLPRSFTLDVHASISGQHSKEYIEAVVGDAMRILPSYKDRSDTLVVINPRRIAVVLHNESRRGTVIGADLIEQVLQGPAKLKLLAWLASPTNPFYVMHIAGNWFAQ